MEEKIIGCCGHECFRCVTYIATIRNDDTLRERSKRFYKEEFGLDIPISEFNCLGCRSKKVFKLCGDCPFVKCAQSRSISSCLECAKYPCELLADYQEKYVNKFNQLPQG